MDCNPPSKSCRENPWKTLRPLKLSSRSQVSKRELSTPALLCFFSALSLLPFGTAINCLGPAASPSFCVALHQHSNTHRRRLCPSLSCGRARGTPLISNTPAGVLDCIVERALQLEQLFPGRRIPCLPQVCPFASILVMNAGRARSGISTRGCHQWKHTHSCPQRIAGRREGGGGG